MSPTRLAVALTVAALLAACGSAPRTPLGKVPAGPEAYQEGYVDGCLRGRRDAEPEYYELSTPAGKPNPRFEDDAAYRQGWEEAYARCYEYTKNHPKKVR